MRWRRRHPGLVYCELERSVYNSRRRTSVLSSGNLIWLLDDDKIMTKLHTVVGVSNPNNDTKGCVHSSAGARAGSFDYELRLEPQTTSAAR
jgi:hypothetical protein